MLKDAQAGVLTLLGFLLLRETYAPIILARRARRRHEQQPITQVTKTRAFLDSILRPAKLLVRSPIAILLALYSCVLLSYMNIIFSTTPLTFQTRYGFTTWQSGFTLYGFGVDFIIAQVAVGAFSDRYIAKRQQQRKQRERHIHTDNNEEIPSLNGNPPVTDASVDNMPEDRLPPLLLSAVLMPAGYLWYGWALTSSFP